MFERILANNRRFDWILFGATVLLVVLGLTAIYSVDLSRGGELVYFRKQLIASGVGMALFIFAAFTQYTFFRSYAKLFYVVSLILLVAVLVIGKSVNGSRSWFGFGSFSFQPLEFAKIGVIFILAYIVYHFGRRYERPLFFVGTGITTLAVMLLIMLERDVGSSLIIGAIWFGVMLLVRARKLHVLLLVGGFVFFSLFAWKYLLHDYQRQRVLVFLYPERDPLVHGYNTRQALIAVGAGQIMGRGLGNGSQSQMRFLPEAQTDFIFSVIAEELGFVGVLGLLALFSVMLWRLLRIVQRSHDDFISVTVCGIALLFFSQFMVNVGANVGLLPVTGVTLPFVSYGGSSLIINLFLVGVAESMVEKRY